MATRGLFTALMYLHIGLLLLFSKKAHAVSYLIDKHIQHEEDICVTCCYSKTSTNYITNYLVDCSNTQLTQIPRKLPINTTCLDLSNNQIENISKDTFIGNNSYSNLKFLSLSNNTLTQIKKDDFKGLTHLTMLDLSLNKIRYYDIDEHSFEALTSLVYLDIKQKFSNVLPNESYPDIALSQVKKLQTLVIDGLYGKHLGNGFQELTALREIFFSGHFGRCNITKMDNDFFDNVRTAKDFSLWMSNCSLEYIEKDTFKYLTNLTALDISWNVKLTFNSLPNVTHGLKQTNITYLNLNSLHEYYMPNECTKLTSDSIMNLQNTSLKILTLESNVLIGTTGGFIDAWPRKMQYLSLRDNVLMLGKYVLRVNENHTLHGLLYLDMAQQFKEHMPPDFEPKETLKDDKSYFKTSPQEVTCRNNDRTINDTMFNQFCKNMFRRNRELNYFEEISNRVARLQSTKTNIMPLDTKEYVYTDIYNDYHDESNVSMLEYLDLSENTPGIITAPLIMFGQMPHLKALKTSQFHLGYNLQNNKEFVNYLKMHTLQVLDLSNNDIIDLQDNTFDLLPSLKELNLSNNRLNKTVFLNEMRNLSYLNLKGNILETISADTRELFDELDNFTLNIDGNNIKCNCQNLNFLKWMIATKVHFDDFDQYRCTFNNGIRESLRLLSNVLIPQLEKECSPENFYTLILVLSLCLLAFIIILAVGLAYRYKWNLRYLYYTAKLQLINGYQQVRTDETQFEKDVFVSYADEDRGFVRENVLPQLEALGNISLLVHDRDFQAGEYVADNIMNAVTSSRRTLVILTSAYLKRKWCLYEINMARLEGIETGRNVLCVMMKEEIPIGDLPLGIMDIIKKKTYLEYPQEVDHQEGFWERMRAAIRP